MSAKEESLYMTFAGTNYRQQPSRPLFKKSYKALILCSILGILWFTMSNSNSEQDHIKLKFKIYSHNVRYDNKNIGGWEKPWSQRKLEIFKNINFNGFDSRVIVTLQEVLKNQLDDLLALLNKEEAGWTYFGVGRNDGKEAGEYSPVLYNTKNFKLIEGSTFWLSETPDIPSKGWDADQTRIVSWAHLESRVGTKINIFNTHLDHIGVIARKESVKLIANKTVNYNSDISFITGDFNSQPNEEAYQTLSKKFKDSRHFAKSSYGYENTFTGFDPNGKGKIIDYVFIDPRLESVDVFSVLANRFEGIFSSDHRPLLVDVTL